MRLLRRGAAAPPLAMTLAILGCGGIGLVPQPAPTQTPEPTITLTPLLFSTETASFTLTILPTETFTPSPSPTATQTFTPSATATPEFILQGPGEVVVPILLYHHIGVSPSDSIYYVSPEEFDRQMYLLYAWGYRTISIQQLVDAIRNGANLPNRPIILPFDDGSETVFTTAMPIMQKYGFTGTAFVVFNYRTNYDRTPSPSHAAAGSPTACDSCHSASFPTWSASFDHNRFFELAGRHLSAACSSCHGNNVYRGTPRSCYPCHQTQYDRTTNPNHRAAAFPTTCETCHRYTDSSFSQGRFNHTWFPITSGRHAGRACVKCHPDSNNYKVFSCTTCHARSETDAEHAGRAGYRYDSNACYS